jgi:phosphonate transport system substrate-binding protein
MKKFQRSHWPLISSWVLGGWLFFGANTASAATLTVGSLSETPEAEISLFLPVVRYLAAGLGKEGFDDARVVVRKTHAEMAHLMRHWKVDLFIDSSLSALKMQRLSGGNFIARRWKKGIAEYRSVVFVRTSSPVRRLADLAGRSIAFEEPYSTSGHLLPAGELRQQGLKLIPTEGGGKGQTVGYRFSLGEENTLLWVLNGRADAGAMADYVFEKLSAPVSSELRLIHKSIVIPYHIVISRPGLSAAVLSAIHRRLLAMHDDPEGQRILKAFENTTRFDDIPAESLRNLTSFSLDF